jgi:hypothetical protein
MMNIDKAIMLLEEVKELQELQRDRGVNSIRQEMIDDLLVDVQKEVVEGIRDNAKSVV